MPIESGSGMPSAAQLPSPHMISWRSFQPRIKVWPCSKISLRIWSTVCSAVAPDMIDAPRGTTLAMTPGWSCSSIWKLQAKMPLPNLVDSSPPQERIRLQRPMRTKAIASLPTVSSPRIFWI